ncbi:MAG TPA: hypothetical protein VF121_01380 [Thermoanaerobaculia bacterium]|nr:hypothetical protein [Thermoanaerobaculia bacterium]
MPHRRTAARTLAGLLLVALAAAAPVLAARPAAGEKVEVTGLVTGPDGAPLPNLRVALEASRSTWSFRELQRTKKDARRVAATTNARGEFALAWPRDRYYNHFELLVGVPVRRPGGERLEVLERVDLTSRFEQGGPVVATVTVQNAAFIAKLRQFVAQVQSADEQRVYAAMGKPDQVQVVNHPDHRETAWWFFESGKVYRFRDGRLTQVTPFEPVRQF